MAHTPGHEPFGIFGKPLRAGLEQERLASFGQAERAQRGANVLGIRTSGVGRIGAQQVARNRALREAAFRRTLGLAQAQQIGSERLQALGFRNRLLELDRERDFEATQARRAFQGRLIGEGIKAGTRFLTPKLFGLGGSTTSATGESGIVPFRGS